MPFNRHGGSGGFNRGGNAYGAKRPWDRAVPNRNAFDDRPKFKATCASCGDACEVPFKPNASKPVYCRNCFKKEGGGEHRTDDRGFNLEEKRLFKTSCDTCGNDCEVPFRPTGERPVYCRECFGKNGTPRRDARFGRDAAPAPLAGGNANAEQFRALNAKLDLIMKALNVSAGKAPEPKAQADEAAKASPVPEADIKKPEVKKTMTSKAPAKKAAAKKKK